MQLNASRLLPSSFHKSNTRTISQNDSYSFMRSVVSSAKTKQNIVLYKDCRPKPLGPLEHQLVGTGRDCVNLEPPYWFLNSLTHIDRAQRSIVVCYRLAGLSGQHHYAMLSLNGRALTTKILLYCFAHQSTALHDSHSNY